jgi:hypothetical protein
MSADLIIIMLEINEDCSPVHSMPVPQNGDLDTGQYGVDLTEWLERCASIPKITSSNPSGGSELTFRSDVLFTARGGSR